jgi:UDP-N-acetylglucosamine 2-epimerase (non-hydrolysing)
MMAPLKIVNVVGARPNLPKIAPIISEMGRHPEIQPILVHTGQHYDDDLSQIFFRQMGIPRPDINLNVGSGSHAAQTAEILKSVEPVLLKLKPDLVVVVGDVNSTIAVSLAASKLAIPIAHVEAGLRSFDRTMPEEINRVLTDAISEYLFVTEESAIENLRREGRPATSIYFVGNVMIDSLLQFLPAAQCSEIGKQLGLIENIRWRPFAVLTLHRPSNVDSDQKLGGLLETLEGVAAKIPVIFPIHPRTRQRLNGRLPTNSQIRIVPPLGYLDFLCLLSHSSVVLTDSGGIQEETTALGIPCLTLRENTERPVTISHGTNTLVGTDPNRILAALDAVFQGKPRRRGVPALWDGRAAIRIVKILVEELSGPLPAVS